MTDDILARLLTGEEIGIDEALRLNESFTTDRLCDMADAVRRKFSGSMLDTCSIINARSGRCGEDCKWCAQSRHYATGVTEYAVAERDRVLEMTRANDAAGVRRLSLVTGGRRVTKAEAPVFCQLYKDMAAVSSMSFCASMGLVDRETLQMLYDAGVRRYHCNLETSSEYFPKLCSTHSHADKLRTIALAREVGMEVCSGGIIGMGETMRDRLLLAREASQAGAVSIPINILNPIPGTPLADVEPLSEDEIIRSVALMRLVAPRAVMRFAGGRARLSEAATRRILSGGMNGVMIGDLLTTVGNKVDDDFALFDSMGFSY